MRYHCCVVVRSLGTPGCRALLGLTVVASLLACTRENPVFGEGGTELGASATENAASTDKPSTTAEDPSATGLSTSSTTQDPSASSAPPTMPGSQTDPTIDPSQSGTTTSSFPDTDSESETDVSPAGCDGLAPCDGARDTSCSNGTKCTPIAEVAGAPGVWDFFACLPVPDNPADHGEECVSAACGDGPQGNAVDTCVAGAACVQGVCVTLCEAAGDCEAESVCTPLDGSVARICQGTCDPLTQGCPKGTACFPLQNNLATCVPAGQQGDGEVCDYINDCQVGLTCAPAALLPGCGGEGCCALYCNLEDSDCEEPMVCRPLFSDPPPALALAGFCGLPMG